MTLVGQLPKKKNLFMIHALQAGVFPMEEEPESGQSLQKTAVILKLVMTNLIQE